MVAGDVVSHPNLAERHVFLEPETVPDRHWVTSVLVGANHQTD
jgi:hypothetical protein